MSNGYLIKVIRTPICVYIYIFSISKGLLYAVSQLILTRVVPVNIHLLSTYFVPGSESLGMERLIREGLLLFHLPPLFLTDDEIDAYVHAMNGWYKLNSFQDCIASVLARHKDAHHSVV